MAAQVDSKYPKRGCAYSACVEELSKQYSALGAVGARLTVKQVCTIVAVIKDDLLSDGFEDLGAAQQL